MASDLELKIAVGLLDSVTAQAVGRFLQSHTLEEFFTLDSESLVRALQISHRIRISRSDRDEALRHAREEARFAGRYGISVLFAADADYPARLAQTDDAPAVIYVLGNPEVLSRPRQLAVVGTRMPTSQGVNNCRDIIASLSASAPDSLDIVSGLAYGIDRAAHEAAMTSGAATAAVLAGGLDSIYPAAHRNLARQIIDCGGALVSEYPSGEKPRRMRFLKRNRIIAGLSDATLVVESAYRGGALSTAHNAFTLNREVFAVPGRVDDEKSQGCNELIRRMKASLVTSGADIAEAMGWDSPESGARQPSLFETEITDESRAIIKCIIAAGEKGIGADEIAAHTCMPIGEISGLIVDLECDGLITALPGSRFAAHPSLQIP